MSDNEIEDISFLPESPRSSKRSSYEHEAERCRQFLCSQKRAICVICTIVVVLFVVALAVAIARPPCVPCELGSKTQSIQNASAKLSTPTATNGEPFPWTDVRLPDSLIPATYSIFVHPNLTTFTFAGHVNISIYVQKSTNFVIIHGRGLNLTAISLVSLSNDGSYSVAVVKQLEYVRNQQFYIRLGQELAAGSWCVLTIAYTAVLSPNLAGFYKSSYQQANGDRRWLGVTQFEATDARAAFPCFDEPAMKANFSLSIVRTKDYITLFNTPKKASRPYSQDGALIVDDYPYSVRMSSYLVAFVVCDFKNLSKTSSTGIQVSVYAQPQLISQGQFALDVGAKVIDFYSDYFGIGYPLDKQDMVAVPDMSPGAMENWGLITYRQTILLYAPLEASASDQQLSAVVVAHELAHQWFGNLVTMKWWNDLWLNEGFASYVEFIGANVAKPEWRMMDQLISETFVPALHKDSLMNSHPISVEVHDPAEINEIFDTISYDKGCCVLRMLEHCIGATAFKSGLRSYLSKHAYNNADSNDLWSALTQQASGIDVKGLMDTWIKQMGYPVVIVDQSGSTVTLHQERFLTNPRSNVSVDFTSPYGYKWKIPVDYISDQNTRPDLVWLDLDHQDVRFNVEGPVKWLKLNVGQHGFYRVHYTPALWQALVQQLNMDHKVLSAADRAGLVDDVFCLARSGYLNISVAMDLSRYLVRETDYVPWSVALTNLLLIEHLLQNDPSYDRYKSYLLNLMSNTIKTLGWRDEGSLLDIYLRDYLLGTAVQLGDNVVLAHAMDAFRAWKINGTGVWPNLKTVVYQAGVQYGTDDDWQFVYQRYKSEIIPSEKRKLLHSLSASNDISRLSRLLQLSLVQDEVRLGDSVSVVTGVASRSAASAALAWHFVKLHWSEFSDRYSEGQFEMTSLITHTTSLFKTTYEYEEVRNFYASHLQGGHKRAVAQALETINLNIDWLKQNLADITRWLHTHTP